MEEIFDFMFSKLLSDLKSSNKVVTISGHFGPQQDLNNMFKYCWNMKETHSFIQITSTRSVKDNKKSEEFRTTGNKFYQKKMLIKALEFYNKSILHSPQYECRDSLNNASENFSNHSTTALIKTDTKNLAIAYANRSAVLFELRKYEECLLDIKRSIEYGYPLVLRIKLIEREIKCYLAQKQIEKAKSLLKDGLIFAKNLDLNQESTSKIYKNLEDLLNKCEDENFTENAPHTNYEIPQYTCIPEAPLLSTKNQDIPSLSNAVSLSYVSERGRYLVADRDISPGEVLINEKCFSFITLPASLTSHCSNCLRSVLNPIPCYYCSLVTFCSEECLSKGMDLFHNTECCILSSLIALELGRNSMLALRLIIQTPLTELKSKIYQYLESNSDVDAQRSGFNESNVYSSGDYQPIYYLVTNVEKRSVSDLFKRSNMAACLVKLLLKTNYFGHSYENLNDISSSELEDIYFVGNVLFTHLMNLPCNAHSITELVVRTSKYQESYIEEIGAGAFGVLSLTNHSCDPSLARSCYGQTIIAKAIKFIPKGSEIFDSYGEHFAIHDKERRQNYLSQQYYFHCACEPCLQNWNLYNNLSDYVLINCTNCSNSFSLQENKCLKCKKSTADIEILGDKNVNNAQDLLQHIQKTLTLYRTSYESILIGNLSPENLENTLNVIYYLSKYARMPNKVLFEAQETLKHCFDRQGSHSNT